MNFKDFFILKERKYFNDLGDFTNLFLKKLNRRVKSSPNPIKAGQVFRFNLPVIPADTGEPTGETQPIDVVFYKGFSRAYINAERASGKEFSPASAAYFAKDQTADGVGRVEIYTNQIKNGYVGGEDASFEDIVNNKTGISPILHTAIRHEIIHAFEDSVRDLNTLRQSKHVNAGDDAFLDSDTFNPSDLLNFVQSTKPAKEVSYVDSDEEHNAYLISLIEKFLEYDMLFNNAIYKLKSVKIAVERFFLLLSIETDDDSVNFYKNMRPEYKNWFKKTGYTYIKNLIDNAEPI